MFFRKYSELIPFIIKTYSWTFLAIVNKNSSTVLTIGSKYLLKSFLKKKAGSMGKITIWQLKMVEKVKFNHGTVMLYQVTSFLNNQNVC